MDKDNGQESRTSMTQTETQHQEDQYQEAIAQHIRSQVNASDPKHSVWVEASAGSGKTRVLVDRVFRILLSGVNPQRILCLTYTRAGAAEVTERLINRAQQWLTLNNDELQKALEELTGSPQGSTEDQLSVKSVRPVLTKWLDNSARLRIYTFHAFCESVLKRFPVESGLSPSFGQIEGAEQKRLIKDCFSFIAEQLNQYRTLAWQKAQQETEEDLTLDDLQDLTYDLSVTSLEASLNKIVDDRIRIPDRLVQIEQQVARALGIKNPATHPQKNPQKNLNAKIQRFIETFSKLALTQETWEKLSRWEASPKMDSNAGKQLSAWLAQDPSVTLAAISAKSEAGSRAGNWYPALHLLEELSKDFAQIFLTGKGTPRTFLNKAHKDKAKQALADGMCAHFQELDLYIEDLKNYLLWRRNVNMLKLGQALIAEYSKRKRARALLDYSDLIAQTSKLMNVSDDAMPWILYKLDGGFDHLLIDEAQDTSPQQWEIVEKLIEGMCHRHDTKGKIRTVFVVGDFKQSIFSFQGADPQKFREAKLNIAATLRNGGQELKTQSLDASFRSGQLILNMVDQAFVENPTLMGLKEDEWRKHKALQNINNCHFEVKTLTEARGRDAGDKSAGSAFVLPQIKSQINSPTSSQTSSQQAPDYRGSTADPKEEFAAAIAKEIQKIENPGDVMILLRTRNSLTPIVRQLHRAGVPVFEPDRLHLVEHIAVRDLINLLQFCVYPDNDLALGAVLRSPFVEMDDAALFAMLEQRAENVSVFQALKSQPDMDKTTAWLAELIDLALEIPPLALLHRVLYHPCPASHISGVKALACRLGKDARDPIEEFEKLIEDHEIRLGLGMQKILELLESQSADHEVKREMQSGKDAPQAVRITTIHGAKGLESPIIIVPVIRQNKRPLNEDLLWANDIPIYVARKENVSRALQKLINEKATRDAEEEARLLYVAMTRAKHSLYVFGMGYNRKEDLTPEEPMFWFEELEQIAKQTIPQTKPQINEAQAKKTQSSEEQSSKTPPAPPAQPAPKAPAWLTQAASPPNETKREARKSFTNVTELVEKIMLNYPSDEQALAVMSSTLPKPSPQKETQAAQAQAETQEETQAAQAQEETQVGLNPRIKGLLVHELLMVASNWDQPNGELMRRFLENTAPDQLDAHLQEVISASLAVLAVPQTKHLFTRDSDGASKAEQTAGKPQIQSELPMVGWLGEFNCLAFGVIDFLCLHESGLWVLDFKTGASFGKLRLKAQLQLALYAKLIQSRPFKLAQADGGEKDPARNFGIIWTDLGVFDPLEDNLLAKVSSNAQE